MAPADELQPGPSTLDALIRLAKKISLLTGLVTGLRLVALYFFGIAIFASYSSAFGVPPFEFSLQRCLEYGGSYADVMLNMVIRDEQWKVAKIGETFLMGLLAAVMISFLFVAPARTAVMTVAMPKVDASIRGLSALTSRSFLIQVAEYERSYAFYVPTKQTILKVPREQVEYVLFKQDVSPFADRSLFRKGSWLGVRGQWRAAAGSRVTESGGAVGFEVATVDVESSGSKAGIKRGDLLVELGGVTLDGSLELSAVATLGIQGKPADLLVSRGGKPLKLGIEMELAR